MMSLHLVEVYGRVWTITGMYFLHSKSDKVIRSDLIV